VARAMVTSYGMSDNIGPVKLSDNWECGAGSSSEHTGEFRSGYTALLPDPTGQK
ncbi:MAG: hypothetical protein D3906_10185, partial [Candidatus Electrothrix sp. AUS1_2]|nr:hypothetical protein [Candidatus Electrothrix sp. AUS1_2]